MSALPVGRARMHSGNWLRGACLVGVMLITGCVNNPNFIALEDLPVREPARSDADRSDRDSGRQSDAERSQPQRPATEPDRAPPASDPENLPDIYTVERGDTLYSIAFRYSRDFRELARANGIDPPYLIVPGQQIDTRATVADNSTTAAGQTPPARQETSPGATPSASAPTAATSGSGRQEESAPAPGAWIWPVRGDILRSFSQGPSGSKGIDIGASAGTAIQASADGTVVYAGDGLRGYGNLIILEHSGRMLSAYAFTDQIAVSEQDRVNQGDVIARVGTRGETALLHFEIRSEGKPVNPLSYLPD